MAAIHGGIGVAAIFSVQASMSVSLAHIAKRIFCLSLADESQRSPSLAPLYQYRAVPLVGDDEGHA